MHTSTLRAGLAGGRPQIGLSVSYPSPGAIERIGPDWDWIWIDGQHGEIGYHDVLAMVRACDLIQRPAFVRVPGHEFGIIGPALDTGAGGLIVPCVDTPEQAQAVVNAAKFPPLGKRSYGSRRAIDRLGRNYSNGANEEVVLLAQIESPEAVENADAIAAIPGVDGLFLGPDDISLRRGYAMDKPRSKDLLAADIEKMIAACRRHNKFSATVGVGDEMLGVCLEAGFNFIVSGGDVPFLTNTSKDVSTRTREAVEKFLSQQSAAQSHKQGGNDATTPGSVY